MSQGAVRVLSIVSVLVGTVLLVWPVRSQRGKWAVNVDNRLKKLVTVWSGHYTQPLMVLVRSVRAGAVRPDAAIRVLVGVVAVWVGVAVLAAS